MKMSKKFLSALSLFTAIAAVAAGNARIRVVNESRGPLELDDGTVVRPGASAMAEVPADRAGTICGEPYPAIPPDGIFTLRVKPAREPVAPSATTPAATEPATPAPPEPVAVEATKPDATTVVERHGPAGASANLSAASPVPQPALPQASPQDLVSKPQVAPEQPRPFALDGQSVTKPASPSPERQAPAGMVLVPAGVNEGVDPEHGPYSLVSPGFYMDQSEVTLAQWRRVYDWAVQHGYRFGHEGSGKGDDHPVHTVSWYDCAKWCNARSEMEGRKPVYYFRNRVLRNDVVNGLDSPDVDVIWRNDGYRLPSRDQWDFAARGGVSSTIFPWGNEITRDNANLLGRKGTPACYDKVSRGDYASDPLFEYDTRFRDGGLPFTCPAGTFPPNGYGLTEMQGNLNEWLNDTSFWIPVQEGAAYGGSWAHSAEDCTLGILFGKERGWANYTIGFRTVLPVGGELPFSLNAGKLPVAVHPDAAKRKMDCMSLVQYDDDGWPLRNPPNETYAHVREERRKWRMGAGAVAMPRDSAPSVVQQDVVPASPAKVQKPPAEAPSPPPPVVDRKVQNADSNPKVPAFHVKRVPHDKADLLVFFKDGNATVLPNANFSNGSILLGLQNRTKHHIAVCVVRVIRPSGTSSDIFFTDIPPGAQKDADNPETLLGEYVGSDFKAEPFLFPALILATGPDGDVVDLYEAADCPSVGYLNVN